VQKERGVGWVVNYIFCKILLFIFICVCVAIYVLFDVNLPSDLPLANICLFLLSQRPTMPNGNGFDSGFCVKWKSLANGQRNKPTPRNDNNNNNNDSNRNMYEAAHWKGATDDGAASSARRLSRSLLIYVCTYLRADVAAAPVIQCCPFFSA